MTRYEVIIAGKRYANAAAYIQGLLGTVKSMASRMGDEPLAVTIRPNSELDPDVVEALS